MAFDFNPITGQLDLVGGGSSYIDGVVADSSLLPVTLGTPPLDAVYLAKAGSGVWLIARKPAGLYVRVANNGVAADWTYLGAFPEVNADGNWELYNTADPTKELKFSLSGLTTGTTRTLTVPDANGTIARTETFAAPPAIGNTTAAAANFTTVGATGTISGNQTTASPPTTTTEARGLQFASLGGTFGNTAAIYGSYPSTAALGIGIANSSAGSITQVAAFTSSGLSVTGGLNANNGTLTASAPVLDLAQTWNNSGVTFTGMRVNATDTASASASNLADFQVGGTSVTSIRKDGSIRFQSGDRTLLSHPNFAVSSTAGGAWFGVNTTVSINGGLRSVGGTLTLLTAQSTDAVVLDRDAANTFAQRNGANAQTFRIYNTFTSATNFERLNLSWASNVAIIGTEKGSAGGSARALELQTDGVTRMTIGAGSGNASSITSAATIYANGNDGYGYSIRTNGAILAGSVQGVAVGHPNNGGVGWAFTWTGATSFVSTGSATTAVNLNVPIVRIGGTTSSFPALKNSSTTLQVRLADDTAFAPFECAGLTLNGNLTASTRNIVTDTTTGTKIGTATTQKIGFFNKTPVVQPAAIADGDDSGTVQDSLNDLLAAMRSLGLIAT